MSIFFYDGKEYFIPPHLIKKHCFEYNDTDWGVSTCYFYKKKKQKVEVLPNKILPDYISDISKYEEDVFYKLTAVSTKSKHFNYYVKIKDKQPKIILLKHDEHKNAIEGSKYISSYGHTNTDKVQVKF